MEGVRIFTTFNSITFQLKLGESPDKLGAAHHFYNNTNIHFQESYWAEKCKHLLIEKLKGNSLWCNEMIHK